MQGFTFIFTIFYYYLKILYEDSDCQYLLDVEDTIEFFEKQNRELMDAKTNSTQDDKYKKMEKVEDVQLQRELALKMRSGFFS